MQIRSPLFPIHPISKQHLRECFTVNFLKRKNICDKWDKREFNKLDRVKRDWCESETDSYEHRNNTTWIWYYQRRFFESFVKYCILQADHRGFKANNFLMLNLQLIWFRFHTYIQWGYLSRAEKTSHPTILWTHWLPLWEIQIMKSSDRRYSNMIQWLCWGNEFQVRQSVHLSSFYRSKTNSNSFLLMKGIWYAGPQQKFYLIKCNNNLDTILF